MTGPFGVDHGPGLREEYTQLSKSMAAQVPGGLRALGRAATTPKKKKLAQATDAGRAARTSTVKHGGPQQVRPQEFDSLPAPFFPRKRKAWKKGYYE
jgi:hypothetical protein